jgi:hypothetical protein
VTPEVVNQSRRHVRTGQPRGARRGNQNALKDGLQSKAYEDRRRATMALVRRVRAAIARARDA